MRGVALASAAPHSAPHIYGHARIGLDGSASEIERQSAAGRETELMCVCMSLSLFLVCCAFGVRVRVGILWSFEIRDT